MMKQIVLAGLLITVSMGMLAAPAAAHDCDNDVLISYSLSHSQNVPGAGHLCISVIGVDIDGGLP